MKAFIKYTLAQLPYFTGLGCELYIFIYTLENQSLPKYNITILLMIIALLSCYLYNKSVNWLLKDK